MTGNRRRVVITGVGCVTPIGTGAAGLMEGLRAGRSAVRSITRFDPSQFRTHVAAEIPDFRPQDFLEQKKARRYDRYSQLSVTAARLALAHAELDLATENRERVGVMMGSALGGVGFAEEQLGVYLTRGLRAVDASLALTVFGGASSCNVAIELGVQGPNSTNAMSCASGTIAVAEAFHAIREGRADVMLGGGAEAPLAPLCFGAFAIIRAMSTRNDDPGSASRPFDKDRDGFVMGEGAAMLVLEERSRALARGAPILAELLGAASSNDAYHMTAPRPDGTQAARCLRLALHDANIEPHEVDYVNAHGSSTPLNDSTETAAFKQVFGDHAYRMAVSGTKGYYGHPLGASGAIEAAVTALALHEQWLPPTVNLRDPDPACDLDYLRGSGRSGKAGVALSNSFGFGGINAAIVMRKGD